MVFWSLVTFGCVFAYLQIGYWLGRLHWWSWHVDDRKNKPLAFLLFPVSTASEMFDGGKTHPDNYVGWHASPNRDRKRSYLGVKAATWPLSLLLNLVAIVVISALAVVCWYLCAVFRAGKFLLKVGGRLAGSVWFCLTEGPAALAGTLLGRPRPPELEAAVARTRVADADERPTLPSVQDKDADRAAKHERLLAERAKIDVALLNIEAEDAADHPDAFREPPQEFRLKG